MSVAKHARALSRHRDRDTGYMQWSTVEEVVIRPRAGGAPDRTRMRFALAFLPLATLGLARQFTGGLSSGLWYLAGFAALALLALLARTDFFAQTNIRVDNEYVRRTGYLGRSGCCPRAAITRVVEVDLITSHIAGIPAKWLLFLDARNEALMRAYAEYYPATELFRLRDALDVPWQEVAAIRTFAQMRHDIPRSFPWALAHIWLTLAIIAVVALLIGGALAASS